jgi:tRNA U34 2-thiouridine synthase MnmA/TrmU
MTSQTTNVKALGLCSGGLDSILSAIVLRRQEIDVEWITFETPFFSPQNAVKAANQYSIPITVKNITSIYVPMLKKPPCGYGQHMNPCLDCHTLMFQQAGQLMQDRGFDFLFSGEVLGQRPMSQTRPSLRYVEKNSGFDGYIIRPLSARCLEETIPEKKGLVDREQLYDFSGRSRKNQMKLAKEFGVDDYPSPAGGCLLTDKNYSQRLRDLFAHQKECTEKELHLLKYGRHFRLKDNAKVIVGRTEKDNDMIMKYHNPEVDSVLTLKSHPGPTVVVPGGGTEAGIMVAATLCAGYGKTPESSTADVNVVSHQKNRTVTILPIEPSKFKDLMV